jgi:hypothetical protein
MQDNDNFLVLAEQVRRGEPGAAARLRRSLEPQLVVIVSRALRPESKPLPLTEWIRAQARQVLAIVGRRPGEGPDWLVAVVACRVGEWLVERLRAGTCSPRLLQDTICAGRPALQAAS